MTIPTVGKIFAAFAKHPLAEQDHRYDELIKAMNMNISSYILEKEGDRKEMLNDDETGFRESAITDLRKAIFTLFSDYRDEFVEHSASTWDRIECDLRPILDKMTFTFEFYHDQMGAIRRPKHLWNAFVKAASGRNSSNMVIYVKLDQLFLVPSDLGATINVFDSRIYTDVHHPISSPPDKVEDMISRLTIALTETNTKMSATTDSQNDMATLLKQHLKNTAMSTSTNPSMLSSHGILVLKNFSFEARQRYAINSDTTKKITKKQIQPFFDH